jgi:hypothetical protein
MRRRVYLLYLLQLRGTAGLVTDIANKLKSVTWRHFLAAFGVHRAWRGMVGLKALERIATVLKPRIDARVN